MIPARVALARNSRNVVASKEFTRAARILPAYEIK